MRVYLALSGSTIKSALFTGDFNEIPASLVAFESVLKWARVDRDELVALSHTVCPDGTDLGVEPGELADLVWSAATRFQTSETGDSRPHRILLFP